VEKPDLTAQMLLLKAPSMFGSGRRR